MRNEYDLLKVAALFLVILGHVFNQCPDSPYTLINSVIYTFHMPLFIALSGAVFETGIADGKYTEFIPFVLNKVRRLLIPFVLIGIVVLAPTLMICGFGKLDFCETICDILVGGSSCRHLWYLQALFSIFMISWSLKRLGLSSLSILGIAMVFVGIASYVGLKNSLFNVCLVVKHLPNFAVGMWLAEKKDLRPVLVFVVSLLMMLVCYVLHKMFCQPVIAQITSVLYKAAIVVVVVSTTRLIMPLIKSRVKWLESILKQSFGIYLFHVSIIYLLKVYLGPYLSLSAFVVVAVLLSFGGSFLMTILVRKSRLRMALGE